MHSLFKPGVLLRSAPQPSSGKEVEDKRTQEEKMEDPKTKEIKRRVESWLKDSEEDANKVNIRLINHHLHFTDRTREYTDRTRYKTDRTTD